MVVQTKGFFREALPKSRGRKHALKKDECWRKLLNVHHLIRFLANTMRSRVRSHVILRGSHFYLKACTTKSAPELSRAA